MCRVPPRLALRGESPEAVTRPRGRPPSSKSAAPAGGESPATGARGQRLAGTPELSSTSCRRLRVHCSEGSQLRRGVGGGAGRARKTSTSAVRVPEPAEASAVGIRESSVLLPVGEGRPEAFPRTQAPSVPLLPGGCSPGRPFQPGARGHGRPGGSEPPTRGRSSAPVPPEEGKQEQRQGGSGRSLTEGLGPPRGPQPLRSPAPGAAFLKACSLRCLLPRASCPALGR